MTKYEIISTVISSIALALSVLIPVAQWVWKKWFMTAIVSFYPTGRATLFFNQSGSYIQINGVIESRRKAVTIKNINISIVKQQNEQKLNLNWSCFISPVNQNMLGIVGSSTEAAHPFRVEEDSIACAFVEYYDPSNSSGIKIKKICSDLQEEIKKCANGCDYTEAFEKLKKNQGYVNARNRLMDDFFWIPDKYLLDVKVEFDKGKKKSFQYEFYVSEQNYNELLLNIDETLIVQLKNTFSVKYTFNTQYVEIKENQ